MVGTSFLVAGLAAAPAVLGAALKSRSSSQLQVETSYGTLQGIASNLVPSVRTFKGVPFAEPPLGSKRWTAPVPPQKWSGVLNATEFGDDCAQTADTLGLFSSGLPSSEDCLYLNIWTPINATAESKLPVYFWIYGGRFEGGAGSVPTYDGSHLAEKDIIVVNFNYRMGPLGFLALPELLAETSHNTTGNYGIMDQQRALEWVREEIANFGGDPDHITVGGQSAGSASSLIMMYSPLTSDKIVGCIAESGARDPHDPETYGLATSHRWMPKALEEGKEFLAEMNVTTLAELRNVSLTDLLVYDNSGDTILDGTIWANADVAAIDLITEPPLWRPVVDGYVLPNAYGEMLASNSHGQVPVMTGDNLNETSSADVNITLYNAAYEIMLGNLSDKFFEVYAASDETEATYQSAAFGNDINRYTTWHWAKDWYTGGATNDVYTYFWNHAPPNQTSGAYHGSELWYTFGNLPTYYNYTWTELDYELQKIMGAYWANFIKTGNPNGRNLTHFPPSRPNATNTQMWLGDAIGAGQIVDKEGKTEIIQGFFDQNPQW